jgi:hypothetical protein
MIDYEKLGVFYLGKKYDIKSSQVGDELVLYDSSDLVTHAFCIGMTGSGKTGLCLGLLEEAAIDGIPVIAIDPKGDLGNLLLTFPDLAPADFEPWVDPGQARRQGTTIVELAASEAGKWQKGLGQWQQDKSRIKRFKDSCEMKIYTPGASAGIPVSILQSLACPPQTLLDDADLLRDRVAGAAACILALIGMNVDALKSREHILLSSIVADAWKKGHDLALTELVGLIQKPPLTRIGALDLESFYPAKERMELSLAVNNFLAAPGFESWLTGVPLDIDSFLYCPEGKPRLSIFSISHLNDQDRMFFVTLLLNQILTWMRGQSGTSSLRAVLYMDEIFGYFPPVSNPPSKQPLLTLLKQARAYGLGIVLASQNPVDIDYKGLSNTGTWFIGRLQTERDKMRVLDGLESASQENGKANFDRAELSETLSSLGNRVFLMNNVHEDKPVIFETRWTLSYLRGPLARQEIKRLMEPCRAKCLSESNNQAVISTAGTVVLPSPTAQNATPKGVSTGSSPGGNVSGLDPTDVSSSPQGGSSSRSSSSSSSSSSVNKQTTAPQPAGATAGSASAGSASAGSTSAGSTQISASAPLIDPAIAQLFVPIKVASFSGSPQNIFEATLLASATVSFSDSKLGLEFTQERNYLVPVSTKGALAIDFQNAKKIKTQLADLPLSPEQVIAPGSGISYKEPHPVLVDPASYKTFARDFGAFLSSSSKLILFRSPSTGLVSKVDENERDFRIRLGQASAEKRDSLVAKLREKYQPKMAAIEEKIRVAQLKISEEEAQAKQAEMDSAIAIGATVFGAFMGRKMIGSTTVGRAATAARGVNRASKQRQDVDLARANRDELQQKLAQVEEQFKAEAQSISSRFDSRGEVLEEVAVLPSKSGIKVNLIGLAWVKG